MVFIGNGLHAAAEVKTKELLGPNHAAIQLVLEDRSYWCRPAIAMYVYTTAKIAFLSATSHPWAPDLPILNS